jgi:HEAT repeat protein
MTTYSINRTALALATVAVLSWMADAPAAAQAPAPATPAPAAKPAAAPAASTLDAILKDIAAYDGGIKSDAVWKLGDYLASRVDDPAARADCETRLVAFLKTATTPVARMVVARRLRTFAGDTAVPALAGLLADEKTADAAIYVLQQIPGAVAEKALVQAVATTVGNVKVAVVAALGARGDAAAIPTLVPLLKVPALAKPAAYSLGKIGGAEAAKALLDARTTVPADAKVAANAALLQCAGAALAAKDAATAQPIYDAIAADTSVPAPMRVGAAIGRINAAGPKGPAVLVEALTGSDAIAREAAIARVRAVVPDAGIGPVCAALPKLPDADQIAVLAALTSYPSASVLPTVLDRAKATSVPVRVAALKALETLGGAAEVPMLVRLASSVKGPEQAAARSALSSLHGAPVDAAIVSMLGQKPADAVAAELLIAIGERRTFTAKPQLLDALKSPSAPIRGQALKALRTIGTPSDIPPVLELLVATTEDAERDDAEKTVGALAQKMTSVEGRGRLVRARLMTAKTPAERAALISILPALADNSMLPVVRQSLTNAETAVREAAVRALSAWPTSAAREDLIALARDARGETDRLLAIAGLVRVIGLDQYREPEAAVADLRLAAGFAWRAEEHKLILGVLPQFPCPEAKDLASSFLGDASVNAEAKAALEKLATPSRRR